MAATITTVFNSAKMIETLQKMIYEWLIAFLVPGTDVQDIYPRVIQDTDTETMKLPWCEYIISVPASDPTGGGALGTEATFERCRIEIAFRTKRQGTDLDLVLLGDKLRNRFKDANNGRPELGNAGLRQANLLGPFPDNSKTYYMQRWFLDFRVLVQNSS